MKRACLDTSAYEDAIRKDNAVAFEQLWNSREVPRLFEERVALDDILHSFIVEHCALQCLLVWLKIYHHRKEYWLDKPSEAGYTFLQRAVVMGKHTIVLSILQMGADPNYMNQFAHCALTYLIAFFHSDSPRLYQSPSLLDNPTEDSNVMTAQTKQARIECAWHLIEFGACIPHNIGRPYPRILIEHIRHALAFSKLAGRALARVVRRVYGPIMRDVGSLLEQAVWATRKDKGWER